NGLEVDDHQIELVNSRDPKQLPWKSLDIDVVVEATGKFKTKEDAGLHIEAGAKKVVITAPGKQVDNTIVMGVNEGEYKDETEDVISNASCTTNCLAPTVKVLDDHFEIINGLMTTVHAFTDDQKNLDNPHKDVRRVRGCSQSLIPNSTGSEKGLRGALVCTQSIIPTSTGAAKALGEVLPHLNGKLHGMALRVPTPNVSLVDLVVDVKQPVTAGMVNEAFQKAAETELHGIIKYS